MVTDCVYRFATAGTHVCKCHMLAEIGDLNATLQNIAWIGQCLRTKMLVGCASPFRRCYVASQAPFRFLQDDLSGADIKALCTEAGLLALRERRMRVTHADFKKVRCSHRQGLRQKRPVHVPNVVSCVSVA